MDTRSGAGLGIRLIEYVSVTGVCRCFLMHSCLRCLVIAELARDCSGDTLRGCFPVVRRRGRRRRGEEAAEEDLSVYVHFGTVFGLLLRGPRGAVCG